jgi:hypothetical protein
VTRGQRRGYTFSNLRPKKGGREMSNREFWFWWWLLVIMVVFVVCVGVVILSHHRQEEWIKITEGDVRGAVQDLREHNAHRVLRGEGGRMVFMTHGSEGGMLEIEGVVVTVDEVVRLLKARGELQEGDHLLITCCYPGKHVGGEVRGVQVSFALPNHNKCVSSREELGGYIAVRPLD